MTIAWAKVRANAGAAGGDGMTIGGFAAGAGLRLARLHRDLVAGTYRPGPLRRLELPKTTGGTRPLAIPSVIDRVAQTAAASVLGPLLDGEMEDSSFGYRPGRSVQMAVRRVERFRQDGYRWVVDGDIERYFDSVPHDRLLARLARSVGDPRLLELVEQWLDGFSADGRGLPQGAPISPLLANLYLDDVDEAIAARGVRLVRFADDFLIMCKAEAAAVEARQRMAAILEQHGLRLHPEKTRVVPFERGFRFLGHLFVRSLVIPEAEAEPGRAPPLAPAAPSAPTSDAPIVAPSVASTAALTAAPTIEEIPARDGRERAPGLRVLYVLEPGRRLSLRNEAFAVEEDGVDLIAVPPQRVDRIELGPGVEADAAALRHAVAADKTIAFVDGRGRTVGMLSCPASRHGARQMAQARAAIDPARRLGLARTLVEGRLRNQRALLRRLNRRREDPAVDAAADRFARIIRHLETGGDVATLMGFEGEAAALYWPALGRTLEHGWTLTTRERRPPPDPVNLVVSFLASMLHRDIAALALRHGLHPGFAVLHQARDGVDAFATDLIEEFRAPLVEGLAVYLFNNRTLRSGMFATSTDDGCRIVPEGSRAVVRGYEAWLDRPVRSQRSGRTMRWRRIVEEQIVAFAEAVEGGPAYRPYRMDH